MRIERTRPVRRAAGVNGILAHGERGNRAAHLDDGHSLKSGFQAVEIRLQPLAAGEDDGGRLHPLHVRGTWFETVRVSPFAHEIEDLHALAAHLAGEVCHQRVQRGNLHGRGIGKRRHQKGREPEDDVLFHVAERDAQKE